MEPKPTLSPNEFKSLYKDPMIESITLKRRQAGAHVPITFAEVVDITDDLVVYYFHEGLHVWNLVGYRQLEVE